MSGIVAYDPAGVRRLTLALLLAFGLHGALFVGVPADWLSLHWPAPRQFDVVLLPPITPHSMDPAASMEPAAQGAAASATLEPAPAAPAAESALEPTLAPTVPAEPAAPPSPSPLTTPQPVSEPVRPARSKPPPAKPPAVARVAPASRIVAKPAAPPKPAQSPPAAVAQSLPNPSGRGPPPTHPIRANRRAERPARDGETATGSGKHGPLDSGALLGQIASIETDNQRQADAGVRSKRVRLTDTQSLAGFYAADWVRKVTRVGEMNFPEVAQRLAPSAGPLLEVAIRADGGLREVRILRSSRNAELDRAARRIVELAAPYPPFPPELRQQYDLLRIEAPWRFDPGGQVRVR